MRIRWLLGFVMILFLCCRTQAAEPIFEAVQKGNIEALRALLNRGVDPNSRDEGQPVLFRAVIGGNRETVQLLIQAGADVNATNTGVTALGLAVWWAPEVVPDLIAAGANVNTASPALSTAVIKKGNLAVVELLLKSGDNVNARDRGVTALMMASAAGSPEIITALVTAGADVNATDNRLAGSLIYASRRGHPQTVRVLLRLGTNLNARDRSGWTALMHAGRENHPRTVIELLKAGAIRKLLNEASLIGAAERGEVNRVAALLKQGTFPDLKDDWGNNALLSVLMRDQNFGDVITKDSKGKIVHLPSTTEYAAILQMLIEHGANVNCPDRGGPIPLLYVTELKSARVLLAAGADVNAKNEAGTSPLMRAATQDFHGDIVRLFLENGADINAVDHEGSSSLHYAIQVGYAEVLQILLRSGADVDIRNLLGETPMEFAKRRGMTSMVTMLQEAGAEE